MSLLFLGIIMGISINKDKEPRKQRFGRRNKSIENTQ